MKHKIILLIIFILSIIEVFACTIGIASNDITTSNKPILWKSRDISPSTTNTIRYVENLTYKFVGVTTLNENRAWMGVNEMGFALANSLSNDLTVDTGVFNNGNLIYNSLGLVGDLTEFENYLDFLTTSSSLDLELRGNFVAFDAQGNSKLYEVNNNNYWIFETDDVQYPYLLRTNHSINGGGFEGIERLIRSTAIIQDLVNNNELSVPKLLLKQVRDVSDSESQPFLLPWDFGDETPIFYTDYSICRRSTISAVVIEGIEEGEAPELTTMWLIMGNPFVTYAIPLLPTIKPSLEAINSLSENSPELVNILWNEANDFLLDTSHFVNSDNFSLLQTFSERESQLYQSMEVIKSQWSNNIITDNDVRAFVNQQVATTVDFSTDLFYNFTPNFDSDVDSIPDLSIYPNPFKYNLTINSEATKLGEVSIKIYNLKGQLVRTLDNSHKGKFIWNGKNDKNEKLSNGVYLIKIDSKGSSRTQKVVLLK